MKKPKKPQGFDDKADASRPLRIDLDTGDDYDDDFIIELEDIVEMPAQSIDEDEDIDLEVEILDAEPGLDFEPPEKPGPSGRAGTSRSAGMGPEKYADRGGDLLDAFDMEADDADPLDSLLGKDYPKKAERRPPERSRGGSGLSPVHDEEDILSLLDARVEPAAPDLRQRAEAALRTDDETKRDWPASVASRESDISGERPGMGGEQTGKPGAAAVESPAGVFSSGAPVVQTMGDDMLAGVVEAEPETFVRSAPSPGETPGLGQTGPAAEQAPQGGLPEAAEAPAGRAASDNKADAVPGAVLSAGAQATAPQPEKGEAAVPQPQPVESTLPPVQPLPAAAAVDEAALRSVADELFARLESRLQENIRALVEAKLPGIVRDVIRQELERITKESAG